MIVHKENSNYGEISGNWRINTCLTDTGQTISIQGRGSSIHCAEEVGLLTC